MTVDNRQTKLRAYRGLGRGRKTCRLQSQLLLVQNSVWSTESSIKWKKLSCSLNEFNKL